MSQGQPPSDSEQSGRLDERVAELSRRIEILESLGEEEFGSFTRLDWIACILLGGVLPLILLYWGAP
jgi:hypothetical protein